MVINGFINRCLEGIVQAQGEAMPEGLELRERKLIGDATRVVKRHVAIKHPVPPDAIADAREEVLDDHEAGPDIRIGADAITDHG